MTCSNSIIQHKLMSILALKRLLYKHRDEIIEDLNLDEYEACVTCVIGDLCYGSCNGTCKCNHAECNNCNMTCHNNCKCNCLHTKCIDCTSCHEECLCIDDKREVISTILNYACSNDDMNMFYKYYKTFDEFNKQFANSSTYLLHSCLSNFGDFKDDYRTRQIVRFDKIIDLPDINFNHTYYYGSLLCRTTDIYLLDKLIKYGTNVNLIFENNKTAVSQLIYAIIACDKCDECDECDECDKCDKRDKCDECDSRPKYYLTFIEKLEYLLNHGADINLGSIHTICDEIYENKPERIEFIRYLMNKGLNTTNKLLFGNKMLYDTNLGKLITEKII